ncbi:hypothetical protein [Pontibacter chitinilyticus]|uniref:hypothetical protein n=1 Tax=Pontibacter chitinilyticus TaxID=2674989 RepID=UPI003219157D
MKKISITGWAMLLLAATACSPKNEEVTNEQIETGSKAQALDTISNMRKDAVKTDENNTSPTLPMPQPVMQLLAQRYPGWQQPELTAEAQQQADNGGQSPTLVRGDYNGDSRQDYALQLQQGNKVIVVAVLDAAGGNWQVYELKQDILFNDRNKLQSLYYLYPIKKGETLDATGATEDIEAPFDAIGLGIENSKVAYLYHNGKFAAHTLAD